MKIAFPTDSDNGLESQVFNHFGSAPFFIVVDSDTNEHEIINNQDLNHTHGKCQPLKALGGKNVDVVVVAIGTQANPIIKDTTPDLETNKWGYIVANEDGKTSKKGVYAGGDIVSGAATVILAMGAGKKAAQAIDGYLSKSNHR